jgi:DNA-binding transcriptional LysR family regulator
MDHLRQLTNTWNYLPAFRAIAEAAGLRGASESLRVSPSALSRSLKQLEDQLGGTLFDRVGRRLILNGRGQRLLTTVREAMRHLDDAVCEAGNKIWSGPLRIWAPPHVAETLVLRAILALREASPLLEFSLRSERLDVEAALLAGQLDVALLSHPLPVGLLECQRFAEVEYGLYCAKRHELAGRRATLQAIRAAEFVGPVEAGMLDDQWPLDWPRRVGLRVSTLHAMVEAASSSKLLVALPRALGDQVGLVRLRTASYTTPLFAARRRRIQDDPVEALLELLRNPSSSARTPAKTRGRG